MSRSISDTCLMCYYFDLYCVVYRMYLFSINLFLWGCCFNHLNKIWLVNLNIPVQHAKRDVGWCNGHTTQMANSLFACSTPVSHKQQVKISQTIPTMYHKEHFQRLGSLLTHLNSQHASQKFHKLKKTNVFIEFSTQNVTLSHQMVWEVMRKSYAIIIIAIIRQIFTCSFFRPLLKMLFMSLCRRCSPP